MKIVKKQTLETIKQLENEEKLAIYECFISKVSASQKSIELANQILIDSRERGNWLQCDCQTTNNPILAIRRFENGKISGLVHLNSRGKHANTCIFKEVEYEESDITSPGVKPISKNQPLRLYKPLDTSGKNSNTSEKTDQIAKSKNQGLTRLARTMYTLISDAKLNMVFNKNPDIRQQYQTIKNKTQKITIDRKIHLSDFFWTFPTQINLAAVHLKKSAKYWPSSSRPFGIFLIVADEINGNEVICKSLKGEIKFSLTGTLKKSSGRLGKASGPFLLIFTITNTVDNPDRFDPYDGFYVPVYAKNQLTPVDSSYERRVLKKLTELQSWWQKKGAEVDIEKPLLDMETQAIDEETKELSTFYVRPDFIIKNRSNNKSIVLEVMGSHEDSYIKRKERITPIMKQLTGISDLIEVDAYKFDQSNDWKRAEEILVKVVSGKILND